MPVAMILAILSFLINSGRLILDFHPDVKEKLINDTRTNEAILVAWMKKIAEDYEKNGSIVDVDDFFKHHPEREP